MFALVSPLVSAQANFNCSVYPRLSVPGDMVRLINIWGNDSHAQFGNMSDYDYSVACKSNITTIDTGCSGNFVEIAQLYSGNDSHVSIDDFYPYQVCFNTSDTSLAWYYNISAISATPSDYECIFSIAMYNDSHVWECDHSDATYNVNLKINSTLAPYAGCVDLDNASTYQGKLVNDSDGFWINQNLSLCRKTYYYNDAGSLGVVIINANTLTLDCNSSLFVGDTTGYGIFSAKSYVTLKDCNVSGYNKGITINVGSNAALSGIRAWNNTIGVEMLYSNNGSLSDTDSWGNGIRGIAMDHAHNWSLSGVRAWDNPYGVDIAMSNGTSGRDMLVHDNSNFGIYMSESWNSAFFNITVANTTGDGVIIGPSGGFNNFTNSTFYNNVYGVDIYGDSSGNLFYYNNFTSNSVLHASSAVSGNYFNTTNGSSCGPQCARGNYWDDVASLDILDSNNDYYGDSGTQYPYNSTYSSKVNANVTDWGPYTTKGCYDNDGDGAYSSASDPSCPGYRDCNDNNANVLPPRDDLTVTVNTVLCSGTYYINDSGSGGVVIFGADDVEVRCNDTLLVGNSSGQGFSAAGWSRLALRDCNASGYATAVFFNAGSRANVSNVSVWNNAIGVDFVYFNNCSMSRVSSWNNSGRGVDLDHSHNCGLYGVRSWDADTGVYIYQSNNTYARDVVVHNNSNFGVYLSSSSNSTFLNLTAANTTGDGVIIGPDSYYNNFTNSTFYGNAYGVDIYGDSSGNLFYYNNFTNNAVYHAVAAFAGNFFNTTNGSSCGANCSRGNYWDDILTLDILDLNGDGFGDIGSQYPYNSTFSSKVNENVTDYGPITTKGCVDADGDGFYPYSASPACPGTYRDCDDTNANILPPKDDLTITQNTILCNGTYYVNDSGSSGIVIFGADSISLTCNGTVIVGNSSGYGVYSSSRISIIERDCTLKNYSVGVYINNGLNCNITNTSLWFGDDGVRVENSDFTNLTRIYAYNVTKSGIVLSSSDYARLTYSEVHNSSKVNTNSVHVVSSSAVYVYNLTISGALVGGLSVSDETYGNHSISNVLSYGNNDTGFIFRGVSSNVTDITVYGSANGYALQIAGYNNTVRRVTAHSSARGMSLGNPLGNNTFYNLTAYNNTILGIYADSSNSNNFFYNTTSYNNTEGLVLNSPKNCVFDRGNIVNNSAAGLRVYKTTSNNTFANLNISYDAIGLNITTGAGGNTFRNNTFGGNRYGVYIESGTTNLFYYNRFLSSINAHAFSAVAGNFFNTTNGSGCGANCSRGNYWDDILSLDIYDANGDGFGDDGPDYPYNAANGGYVSANVQDEGPITTKGPPAPPAAASMVIFGPNGTEFTSTRNVFINITFGTAVACRWANDAESNLALYPWENCTTVKPWILSESEGNKTVYMETKTAGGATTIVNDSIIYAFVQDYTPPTAPVVYDSNYGYDIDWWNSNTTLSAYWWNATDDISTIYYKYRILDEGACYGGDCSWTDAGENTDVVVTGLSLTEGRNYSFQVVAYISSGLNSSIATSNGTKIDLTPPSAPIINSTTHPIQTLTYTNGTVRLNFTASDPIGGGVFSGIDGYSYLIDEYPGTAPDDNMEDRYWFSLEEIVNDGHAQLLRANSSAGSPHTYAVFSQLKSNFTAGETVRVRVAMAELSSDYDDLMATKVYIISVADGSDITVFNNEPAAITSITNVSRDVRYAEYLTTASIYEFDLTVSSPFNDNLNDAYVVVTGLTTDNDNRNNLSIAYSTTSIDNSTKNYVVDNAGSWARNTSDLDYAIEVKKEDSGNVWDVQYNNLQDGTYYFHAKAKDIAGNWGDTSHYKLMIDTAGVRIDIISPSTGQLFSTENITATVKVNDQANVTVFAIHPDGSNDTSEWVIVNSTYDFNITLENGTNRLYAAAINPSNGVVTYSPSVYVFFGPPFVGSRTLRVVYTGAPTCTAPLCVASEAIKVGMATENAAASFGVNDITEDTGFYTIKIFATNPNMPQSSVESDLKADDFLDRKLPMFGYDRDVKEFVIRTEVRYPTAYLTGERTVGPGKYNLVLRNLGTTPEGKANVSVRII